MAKMKRPYSVLENNQKYKLPSLNLKLPNALQAPVDALLSRVRDWSRDRYWTTQDSVLMSILALGFASVLWILSLLDTNPDAMGDLGLISVLPLSFYAALAILTISFILHVNHGIAPAIVLALHVVLLILMIHGTPAILYGTLRYSWAWKHVGIVDYILRHGTVDPNIGVPAIYHNWPGFFALGALFTELAGLDNPRGVATWAPVYFNLLSMGALVVFFKAFTDDKRLVWLGVWFFFSSSWVAQDYFAPQALGFFAYLVIIGICFHWFRFVAVPKPQTSVNGPIYTRVAKITSKLFKQPSVLIAADQTGPLGRAGLLLIVVLLFIVIALSHQLTPLITIGSLTALVLFRRINLQVLPVIMIVITLAWSLNASTSLLEHQLGGIIETIGELTGNIDAGLTDLSQASSGHQLIAQIGRVLTVSIMGLATLGGIRWWREGNWDVSAVLLGLTPFAILVALSYGGEILFRVYLFALPFMAFLAATLYIPSTTVTSTRRTIVTTIVLSGALLCALLFSYLGKERQYYFTRDEVAAAEYLYSIGPPGSLLIEGGRNYPSQFHNYENFTYVPISREDPDKYLELVADPVTTLSRWLDNDDYAATYLIITRSQKAEIDAFSGMPPGSLDAIQAVLQESPQFEVIYSNADAVIFNLADVESKP